MGRVLMYLTIAALAVFVVSTFTFLEHGNQGLGLVKTLTPSELAREPQPYVGAPITVDGTLVYNEGAGRYQLTDEQESVALRGLDELQAHALVGKYVRVSGIYESSGGARRINIESIHVVDEPTGTASPS